MASNNKLKADNISEVIMATQPNNGDNNDEFIFNQFT